MAYSNSSDTPRAGGLFGPLFAALASGVFALRAHDRLEMACEPALRPASHGGRPPLQQAPAGSARENRAVQQSRVQEGWKGVIDTSAMTLGCVFFGMPISRRSQRNDDD
ncbi:hypothetical protein KC347_g52 [Hortaea werneckii]|nr:hypothetical protein KC347_g52 [Hortaea werneckii]